jgi:hypothetical protein
MNENDIKNDTETDIIELPNQDRLIQENKKIKLARLDKTKGICSSCHRKRVIRNKEFNLCYICDCAKKYWGGNSETETNTNNKPDVIDKAVIEVKDKEIEKDITIDDIEYYCDICNEKIKYGIVKCHKCNSVLNWLGTRLENDSNFLICGVCGSILNRKAKSCFNCGYGGN